MCIIKREDLVNMCKPNKGCFKLVLTFVRRSRRAASPLRPACDPAPGRGARPVSLPISLSRTLLVKDFCLGPF